MKVSQDCLELRRVLYDSEQVVLRLPQAQEGNIALLVSRLEPRQTLLFVA
jgi:hypothetical protein